MDRVRCLQREGRSMTCGLDECRSCHRRELKRPAVPKKTDISSDLLVVSPPHRMDEDLAQRELGRNRREPTVPQEVGELVDRRPERLETLDDIDDKVGVHVNAVTDERRRQSHEFRSALTKSSACSGEEKDVPVPIQGEMSTPRLAEDPPSEERSKRIAPSSIQASSLSPERSERDALISSGRTIVPSSDNFKRVIATFPNPVLST